jgi:hypothetical protein
MIDELTRVAGWGCFCDEARIEELTSISRQEGSPAPWVYFLPPDVMSILYAERFWEGINSELGTWFDRAEEEEIGPSLAASLAERLEQFARADHGTGSMTRTAGWRADGSPIMGTVQVDTLRGLLLGLVDFLRMASEQGWVVEASF